VTHTEKGTQVSQHSLFLFQKYPLVSCPTLFRLPELWLGSYNHCNLACFLGSIKSEPSSQSYSLCCIHPYWPTLSSAENTTFSTFS
jgi:hypothetical protein